MDQTRVVFVVAQQLTATPPIWYLLPNPFL